MSSYKPTPEQQAAIDADLQDILVSASAGTGKTRVMTERLIQRVLRGQVELREVLVLTFTDAASNEMRRRIGTLLEETIAQHPEKKRELLRQRRQLRYAQISTLHAFCLKLIRDYRHLLVDENSKLLVPPDVRPLEPELQEQLKREALEELMTEGYAQLAENETWGRWGSRNGLWQLIDVLGSGKSDEALRETILAIYGTLRSFPDYRETILCAVETSEEISHGLMGPGIRSLILEELAPEMEHCRQTLPALEAALPGIQFYVYDPTKTTKTALTNKAKDSEKKVILQSIFDGCHTLLEKYDRLQAIEEGTLTYDPDIDSWDAWRSHIDVLIESFKKRGLSRAKSDPERSAYIDLFDFGVRRLIERFTEDTAQRTILFRRPEDEIQAELQTMLPAIHTFAQLLLDYDEHYSALKSRYGGIDFDDFEHLALHILRQEEAQKAYRQHYREVYVDEYQDTSEIQESLLEAIGAGKSFRVGDVKQSIYRFRAAEPRLFLNRLEAYERGEGGALFALRRNFRSEPGILKLVNQFFSCLMKKNVTEIEYSGIHEFVAGKPPETIEGDALRKEAVMTLSLLVEGKSLEGEVPDLSEKEEAQDAILVSDIRSLLDQGVAPGDICILARSHKFCTRVAAKLTEEGLDYSYARQATSDFPPVRQRELQTLIQILDNPRQDRPLAAVLLSDFVPYPFTEEELLELKLHEPQLRPFMNGDTSHTVQKPISFHALVLDAPLDRLSDFPSTLVQKLQAFRAWLQAQRAPIGEDGLPGRFARIFDVCDFGTLCALSEDPRERDLPEQFLQSLERQRSLHSLGDLAQRLAKSPDAQLNFDLPREAELEKIQIMTYHGSKGLEFPYLFLPDLERGLFSSRNTTNFHYDRKLGFTLTYQDPKRPLTRPNLLNQLLRSQNRRQELAEEMRLLYVALTRAERKIYAYAQTKTKSLLDKATDRQNFMEAVELFTTDPEPFRCYYDEWRIREITSNWDALYIALPEASRELLEENLMDFVANEGRENIVLRLSDEMDLRLFNVQKPTRLTPDASVAPHFVEGERRYEDEGPLLPARAKKRDDSAHALEIRDIDEKWHFLQGLQDVNTPQAEAYKAYYQGLFDAGHQLEMRPEMDLKFSVTKIQSFNKGNQGVVAMEHAQEDEEWRSLDERFEAEEKVEVESINQQIEALSEVNLESLTETEAFEPLQGAARGTAIHHALRYLDWSKLRQSYEAAGLEGAKESYLAELHKLHNAQVLTRREIAAAGEAGIVKHLARFVGSDVGEVLATSKLLREQSFTLKIPASELYPGAHDAIHVQGTIDLIWLNEHGAGLIDFKTGFQLRGVSTREEARAILEQDYQTQIDLYSRALERSGITPKVYRRVIVHLDQGMIYEL